MGNYKRRIFKIEKTIVESNPVDGMSMAELMEIIDSHDWTDEELEECPYLFGNISYRRLLDIARRGA